MANFSPAAQAVLDAYEKSNDCYREEWGQLAAALVAVADQVVPLHTAQKEMRGHDLYRQTQRLRTRCDLLAIAAELEASPMALTVVIWKPND